MVWEQVAEVKGLFWHSKLEEGEEQGHSLSAYSLHPSLPGLLLPPGSQLHFQEGQVQQLTTSLFWCSMNHISKEHCWVLRAGYRDYFSISRG